MYYSDLPEQIKAAEILNSATPNEIIDLYNSHYSVHNEYVDFYNRNGFVKIPNLVPADFIAYVNTIISSAVAIRKKDDLRTLAEKSDYEKSFMQCGFLCFDFSVIKDFVFAKRFAGIAKQLLKAEGIRLWHDQALYKEPGGRHTPVHQDCSYWPIKNPEFSITMWLALNDVTQENGALYFYPNSHQLNKEYVDIFNKPHYPEQLRDNETEYFTLNAGDATFHSGMTFHGAFKNNSKNIRKGMTVIYIDDQNTFDASDIRNTAHKSCCGLEHGQKIETEYTPKLI